MEITRKPGYEVWLLDKVKTWLQAQPRAEGIHVSDLVYPLKGYWRRVDPQPISDAEAGYFVAGQGHHYVLEAIIGGSEKVGKADGGTYEWEGIYYSPDIETPSPVEIKTSRARFAPKSEAHRSLATEYATYLKQLTAYMAIRNQTQGDLIVFYLNLQNSERDKRSTPRFRWYRVELTEEELAHARHTLLVIKQDLEQAVSWKDPSALQPCPDWLCRSCVWATKCPGAPKPKEKPEQEEGL